MLERITDDSVASQGMLQIATLNTGEDSLMATITIRTKIRTANSTEPYRYIQIPSLKRSHCDMAAFRSHPQFRPYANSDLFLGMVTRELRKRGIGETLKVDTDLPDGVSIDDSGFLAVLTITI